MEFLSIDSVAGTLTTADWLMMLIICLWFPVEEFLQITPSRQARKADLTDVRLHQYNHAIARLWMLAGGIALLWILEGRDWAALGLRFDGTWRQWIALAAATAMSGVFLAQLLAMHRKAENRKAYADQVENAGDAFDFMPHSGAEYRRFMGLGMTAGITEEIIFRGFLIWALGAFMPIWAAILLALFIFVILHAYQGLQQLIMVTLAGTILTLIYVLSGSLYPAILAHILADVLNGSVWWRAVKERVAA